MIRKLVCHTCGIEFEAASFGENKCIFCPNCSNQIEFHSGEKVEVLGGYKIRELLGQGGMGQVYKAESPDGMLVALKIMAQDAAESPEMCERFERETAIMDLLEHENIVRLLDRGTTGQFRYFIMELVDGISLRSIIRKGEIAEEKIAKIVIQILEALKYAHRMGIIHRDIKPENILITHSGIVKVTDFGLARKQLIDSQGSNNLTATNAFMGTENYMSPEQKINPKAVTHKSDIYSLGIVLYEMLTNGMLPMGIFQPPSHFRQMHEFWDLLIFRMLDLNPEMRPGNCGEIIEAINAYLTKKTGIFTGSVEKKQASENSVVRPKADSAVMKGEDPLSIEMKKIDEKIESISRKAVLAFDTGEYEESAKLWENLLLFVTDTAQRDNILEWIRDCKTRIHQNEENGKEKLLCPGCLKVIALSGHSSATSVYSCPNCHEEIVFDAIYKRWIKKTETVKKTAVSSDLDHESFSEAGKRRSYYSSFSVLVLLLVVLDLFAPDMFEAGFACLHNVILRHIVQTSMGMTLIWIRFILYGALMVVGLGFCYSYYGIRQRKRNRD